MTTGERGEDEQSRLEGLEFEELARAMIRRSYYWQEIDAQGLDCMDARALYDLTNKVFERRLARRLTEQRGTSASRIFVIGEVGYVLIGTQLESFPLEFFR